MEINISSEHINENSINDILIFLKTKSITAQVFKTSSIVKYINEYKVEHGLRINFFDTSKEIFKDIVWSFLKKKYKLTCA